MSKKITFALMTLKKWLKSALFRGVLKFLPIALLASAADAAVLWGIRAFMDILSGDALQPLPWWLALMLSLTVLRLVFLALKVRISESWIFSTGSRVSAWFLHRLRLLHPKNFHTPEGDRQVEAAYESTQVLQNNGGVFFQGAQAILQLSVFLPVLLYISWPLTLFLFVVIVPVVGALQRKLHKLGPAEENILRARSQFRGDLTLARRLFLLWSSRRERTQISDELLVQNRNLRDEGLAAGLRKNSLSLVTESVSVIAMVLVLGFCAVLIHKGWMDGSGLVLFCSAVLLSYKPVKECARVMPQFRSAMSALKILEDFEKRELRSPGQSGAWNSENKKNDPVGNVFIQKGKFQYGGSDGPVFDGVELLWTREKPVLVRGKNGAGKSTFLRLLAGLEQWNSATALEGPGDVFFVAQDLELPPRKYLLEILENAGVATAPSKISAVTRFMQFANVGPLLHKTGLSGGERSRVALLWSLASPSKTILLDEPFAAIALDDREPLLAAFLDCAEQLQKWVVIVSHDVLSLEMKLRFNEVTFGDATVYGTCGEGACDAHGATVGNVVDGESSSEVAR